MLLYNGIVVYWIKLKMYIFEPFRNTIQYLIWFPLAWDELNIGLEFW